MSIRGIDTQMMITRLPDNVKEASDIQKRPEHAQQSLAYQAKLNEAQEQMRIAKTMGAEMENIRTDVDGSSGNAYEGEGSESGVSDENEDSESENTLMVPPGSNTIDIRV